MSLCGIDIRQERIDFFSLNIERFERLRNELTQKTDTVGVSSGGPPYRRDGDKVMTKVNENVDLRPVDESVKGWVRRVVRASGG